MPGSMKFLDAEEVIAKLRLTGHDYNPASQQYKNEISAYHIKLYDPTNLDEEGLAKEIVVWAADGQRYADKGMLTAQPEKPKASKRSRNGDGPDEDDEPTPEPEPEDEKPVPARGRATAGSR